MAEALLSRHTVDSRRRTIPRQRTKLPRGWGIVARLIGFAMLAATACPAHATCWTDGDRQLQALHDRIDTNPSAALPAVDSAILAARQARSPSSESIARLLSARAAALVDLLRYDDAEKTIKDALALAGKDPVLRAEIIDQYVSILFMRPGPELQSWLRELDALRKRLPVNGTAAVCATNALSILQRANGDTQAAMSLGGDAYRAAKAAHLGDQAAFIALNLATINLSTGDYEQADDLAREAETSARARGFTFHLLLAAFMRAQIATHGHPDLAARKFLEASRLSRRLGIPSAAADQGACEALLALDKIDQALGACRAAEKNADPSDIVVRLLTGRLLGEIETARGQPQAAIARYNALLAPGLPPALEAVADRIRQSRARAYAGLGRFREAYSDMKVVAEHSAVRVDAQRARDLANTRARFGWDRQRIANAELERDLALSDARVQRNRLWLWTAAGWALLLIVTLTWVLITGKRHRRRLEALASEARDLARTKADLLANMSHEIRSPLGTLTFTAQRLAEAPDIPFENRQRADRLGKAGERLISLLDDLLLFSRIDAQQLPIVPALFDPRQLVRESANLLEPKVQSAGAQLMLDIDDHAPASVQADRNRLMQIITNLVDNAVRHSGASKISVALAKAEPEHFRITVRDDGKGIPEESKALLFQRFSQIDGSSSTRGGSGLGLAICKGLVELMGGTVSVDDVAGGFQVTLTLPVNLPEGSKPERMVTPE